MLYTSIIQNVTKYISLSTSETKLFQSLLKHKKIKAKKFFLNAGDVCLESAFVIKGCLRSYTVDDNGLEHILAFAPAGWWIGDLYSFISQKPGILYIEAIEYTELLLLSKLNQEVLFEQVPKSERFFRKLVENSLVAYHERTINNLSLTAVERYEKFCKTYPQLIDYLPHKHIAAYIGVTPEFFSRMIRKLKNII